MKGTRTVLVLVATLASSVAFAGSRSLPESLPAVDERPALPYPPGIDAESICGTTDELQDVELYDGTLGVSKSYVDTHQPTTLQLQWVDETTMAERAPGHALGNVAGARWCTGTLVGESLILTAGHCFDVQDGATGWFSPFTLVDGNPVFLEPARLAELQVVHFLYQIDGQTKQLRTAITFPIVELVEYRRHGLDYAVVRVGPGADGKLPGEIFPTAEPLTRLPSVGEPLAVIQHPRGEPKKIEAGRLLKVVGSSALYDDIDTYGASSGSGVRDAQGKLIAVHTNGGCNTHGGNRGVTTAAIAQASDAF